jgi:myo-inositol-1(or 4)-monophosphatase
VSASPPLGELLQTAGEAARAAGEIARRDYQHPKNVRQKHGIRDLVTDTDIHAQAAALEIIGARYPDHAILAEESAGPEPANGIWTVGEGLTWAVDPVDGTTNFTLNLPMFCTSVGVVQNGMPVAGAIYDPLRDELFSGARGLGVWLNSKRLPPLAEHGLSDAVVGVDWSHEPSRRQQIVEMVDRMAHHCRTVRSLGSAVLGLAYVAAGRMHVYANFGLKPWDTAVGAVLIGELGGEIRQPDGAAWSFGESWLIAGHPILLDEVRERTI